MPSEGTDPDDSDEERIDRKHTHPVADGGSKYRDPIHADADRSEVPHDYEGPTKLERITTPRVNGNVTEMVEVPDRDEKARRERERERQEQEDWQDEMWEDAPDTDGSDVSKSTQAEMKDALADADFYNINGVEKDDDDPVDLSWSEEDFGPDPTEADLLAEIRDELPRMNAADRERALKSLADTGAGQRWVGLLDAEGTDESTADAVATLERLEERLAAEEPTGLTEEQAEAVQDALNLYVEAEESNSVDDSLADIVAWMRDQAGDLDGQARGKVYSALASIDNTEMEQSETLV